MLQQDPYFLFSRPMTYFGCFQHLENECEIDEEVSLWSPSAPFSIQLNMTHRATQNTGVYLHWFDS